MRNTMEFTNSQGQKWRWVPVPIESESTPILSYVGIQPGGARTAVTRLTDNYSSLPVAFERLRELQSLHPGAGVFEDFNS